eukprot:jgi/Chrzof1/10824/Cz05g13150.t1
MISICVCPPPVPQALLSWHQPLPDSFMTSFFSAASCLLDTFSAPALLELLHMSSSAGHMAPHSLVSDILQSLESDKFRLKPAVAAAALYTLAVHRIRPSGVLLGKCLGAVQCGVDRMSGQDVLRVLWSILQYQVMPPVTWLDAIVSSVTNKLSDCPPPVTAGIVRCLQLLGVTPTAGFHVALLPAVQANISEWDIESLSILGAALAAWGSPLTPDFESAVIHQAGVGLAEADGRSLVRLLVFLSERCQMGPDPAWMTLFWGVLMSQLPSAVSIGSIAVDANNNSSGSSMNSSSNEEVPLTALVLIMSVIIQGWVLPEPFLEAFWCCACAAATDELLDTREVAWLLGCSAAAGLPVPQGSDLETLLKCAYRKMDDAPSEALEALLAYHMPGKVRENIMVQYEYAVQREKQQELLHMGRGQAEDGWECSSENSIQAMLQERALGVNDAVSGCWLAKSLGEVSW